MSIVVLFLPFIVFLTYFENCLLYYLDYFDVY